MANEDRSQPILTILADDLSGAADCAVAYAKHGLNTSIVFNTQQRTQCDVVAIDADSRHLTPEASAQTCLSIWRAANNGRTRLYKKIDSTLRGNWISEVAALLPDFGMAILAPAMPAMKRTTREGRQYIDGVPVEETEAWKNDQITGKADICAMLAHEGVKASLLPLKAVRDWRDSELYEWLAACQANGTAVVVCDSETNADLQRIAQVSAGFSSLFWVGSAGLAHQLCDFIEMPSNTELAMTIKPFAGMDRPILTVVGSMSKVSHQQVTTLHESSPKTRLIMADVHELLTSTIMPDAIVAAVEAIDAGLDVIVQLKGSPDPRVNGRELSNRLAGYLASQLSKLGGVIATGGETARALLSAAEVQQLRIVAELEPGVVMSLTDNNLPVITKAGGFGQADSLRNAWQYLQRLRSPTTRS